MSRHQVWAGIWFGLLAAHLTLLLNVRGGFEFAGSVVAVGMSFAFLLGNLRNFWSAA